MVVLAQEKSVNMTSDLNDNVKLNGIEGNSLISEDIKDVYKEKNHEESMEAEVPLTPEIDESNEKLELNAQVDDIESEEPKIQVEVDDKGLEDTAESNKNNEQHKKGILKYQRTYSNKHVDFNMDLEFVPFDETKDYTIEIQIVEQMPKKVVSYAALFAQQQEEEKRAVEEKEKQKRKHKTKRKHCEWKKLRKNSRQLGDILLPGNNGNTQELEEHHTETEEDEDESSENGYLSDNEHEKIYDSQEGERLSESEGNGVSEPSRTHSDLVTGSKEHQNYIGAEYNENCLELSQSQAKPISENAVTGNIETVPITRSLKERERKGRSHSLTELECPRLSHRHAVLRTLYTIHLILTRQQEQQQYCK